MACTDPCSCCHGACCTDGSCAEGLNCFDCEAEGGVWQGAGSTCTPNPCEEEECETDEDCCFDEGWSPVPPCSGSGETKCCPEGSVGWVDDMGDARSGNCVDDCDPAGGVVAGPGSKGFCCDNVCQAGECYICCCCDDGVDVTCYSFDISSVPAYETDCVTGVSTPIFGNTFGDPADCTFSYTYGECEAPPP